MLFRSVPGEAGRTRFEVTDTGVGMDEQARGQLFQPFSQADQSTSRQYGGTGLGLALVKRMVEMQRGEIDVDSVPGEGTRFRIRIPGCLLDEAAPVPRGRERGESGASASGVSGATACTWADSVLGVVVSVDPGQPGVATRTTDARSM